MEQLVTSSKTFSLKNHITKKNLCVQGDPAVHYVLRACLDFKVIKFSTKSNQEMKGLLSEKDV